MSTRSTVGYRTKAGKVSAVYCHFDGYPEWMVYAISRFTKHHGIHKFMYEIRRAQREGGMRSIGSDSNGVPVIVTYGDMRDDRSEGDEWKVTQMDLDEGQFNQYAYIVSSSTDVIAEFYSANIGNHNAGISTMLRLAGVPDVLDVETRELLLGDNC